MISQTEENYLKAIYALTRNQDEANVNEIGKLLNIKMSTVNNMIKKLSEKGLILYESYKPVRLTDKGEKQAALVVRKHRLTEMFLVEKMGFGWEEVHEIAEQIEHIKSKKFFEKMDEILGYPKVDPHGSAIPDKHGKIKDQNYISLLECKPGNTVIFKAVNQSSDELLKYLNSKNIELGTEINITSIEPFDNSLYINYNDRNEVISSKVSAMLMVELL